MEDRTAGSHPPQQRSAPLGRFVFPAVVTVVLVSLVGFLGYRPWAARQTTITDSAVERISAAELEERYGLRVRLIAVTAGGGMVDLRIRILNAEQASLLLGHPPKMPLLVAEDGGTTLQAPEGSMMDDVQLQDGGVLILLYANAQHAINPGSRVTLIIGDLRLEHLIAQ